MACAAGAVCAPVASAGVVSNAHPLPADPAVPEPAPATYQDLTGVGTTLKLQSDGPSHNLTFTDTVALEPFGGILDGEDTCQSTDPTLTDPGAPWTCPLASRLAVDLGGGDDTVQIGDNMPPLIVDGNDGTDTIDFSGRGAGMSINLGVTDATDPTLTDAAPGVAVKSVEGAAGTDLEDTITGDASANPLSGNGGSDTVNGAGGNDTLNGNGGNDTLSGNDGNDALNGNVGDDTLNGNDGNDTLNGGDGVNTLRGGNGDDTLNGSGAEDTLIGGSGIDNYFGGAGDDQIVAIDGVRDNITCSPGHTDTVFADLGAEAVVDNITNPTDCLKVTGTVATKVTTTETLQPVIVVPSSPTGPVPVLAPGKADFADLTPPSASMRSFTRQRLSTVVKRGVPIRVTCKEACGISIALSVDRTTARRLKLDSRTSPVVIATATAKRHNAGTSQLRAKFTKPAKAALAKSKRGVIVMTQVLVSDASGNGTLLSRRTTFVH